MNNQVQFVCLQCCGPPDFVVQINNFFSLVLFSAAIHKRRGKKLISKTIKYKLRRNLPFLSERHSKIFLENYRFCQKSGNDANSMGVMFFASLWRSAYENRYVIHPLQIYSFLYHICYFSHILEQYQGVQITRKVTFLNPVVKIFVNQIWGNIGIKFDHFGGSVTRLKTFFVFKSRITFDISSWIVFLHEKTEPSFLF